MNAIQELQAAWARAWEIPEKLLPSVWVEQNLRIPDNQFNPEPGPYRFDRTPYWREVLDAAIDPVVREIWVYKANQVGFTQLVLAFIAYCAAQEPGALGLLMPDEEAIDELFEEQLCPMIDQTPALAALKTGRAWDITAHEARLTTMPILGLYSGGFSKLEKRTLRYVIGDEINLYRDIAGEASAISRLLTRITNWGHRGKAILGSKPTTPDGNITRGFESCPDKRHYFMPCPHCGKYQDWRWSQVKGFKEAKGTDKHERANWVKLNQLAWYECENCRKPIPESQRMASVRAGRWVSGTAHDGHWTPTQSVSDSGQVTGPRPPSMRVGVWVWGIMSPWITMPDLAAQFIEAEADVPKTRSFRNSKLALPYQETVKAVRPSIVREKRPLAGPPQIAPRWASLLLCTVDTQTDWLRWVIRAWGGGYKSALVAEGFIHEANAPVEPDRRKRWVWDQVYEIAFGSRFSIDGEPESQAACRAMLIDSGGDRTNEVYEFSVRDPRILPTKGMSRPGNKLYYDTEPKPGIRLWMVDTTHFKGALWTLLHDADPTRWLPHREVNEQYCLEMASESLVKDGSKWTWKENGTARTETWDCEVLQRAGAEMFNVSVLPAIADQAKAAAERKRGGGDETESGGWMDSWRGRH